MSTSNERVIKLIIRDAQRPIKVRSKTYGTFKLRRLMSGDLAFIEENLRVEQPAREFVAIVIHHQIESPKSELERVREWNDKFLLRAAKIWAEYLAKNSAEFLSKPLNFDLIRSVISDYITARHESFRSLALAYQPTWKIPESAFAKLGHEEISAFKASARIFEGFNKLNQEALRQIAHTAFKSQKETLDIASMSAAHVVNVKTMFNAVDIANKSMLGSFEKLRTNLVDPELQLGLSKMAAASILSQASLARLDLGAIGNFSSARDQMGIELARTVQGLTKSFSDLVIAKGNSLPEILSFPSAISALPPIEYFNASNVLETFTVDESRRILWGKKKEFITATTIETDKALYLLLADLDPNLIEMLRGANDARKSSNPDRARHFSISARELLSHVLRLLAPDEEVRKWTKLPDHYKDGKPTRKARLLFICRTINSNRLNRFVEKDTVALLELMDILHGGTHGLQSGLTDEQMRALDLRLEGALRFLLEIGRIKR